MTPPTSGPTNEPETDARFLLANERTLLAWTRTSVTMLAGGLAVTQLASSDAVGRVFGAVALLVGAWSGALGLVRYRAADAAIRAGRLPSRTAGPVIMIGLVVVIGLALFAVVALGAW